MNLKNYTSEAPAGQTISYIENYLMNCGATGIAKDIKKGQVTAILFQIPDQGKLRNVKLDARLEAVQEALWKDYCKSVMKPRKTKEDFAEQASRTAWKIMSDWVQVQMSIVMMQQGELLQVFLSYIWDGEQTYYEYLKGTQFKALPAPK